MARVQRASHGHRTASTSSSTLRSAAKLRRLLASISSLTSPHSAKISSLSSSANSPLLAHRISPASPEQHPSLRPPPGPLPISLHKPLLTPNHRSRLLPKPVSGAPVAHQRRSNPPRSSSRESKIV